MEKETIETVTDLPEYWDWHDLKPDPNNPPDRVTPEKTKILAEKIRASGLKNDTFHVRREGDDVIITDGNRRRAALVYMEANGWPTPFIVRLKWPKKDAQKIDIVLDAIHANDTMRFTPPQEAEKIDALLKAGYKPKEIAAKMGVGVPHVNDMLALLKSAPELKEAALSGEVPLSTATKIAKANKGNKAAQAEAVAKVAEAARVKKVSGKKLKAKDADKAAGVGKKEKPAKPAKEPEERILCRANWEVQEWLKVAAKKKGSLFADGAASLYKFVTDSSTKNWK